MLIIVGGNDIGSWSNKQITEGILYIAHRFSSINIQPIIAPIFNREAPHNITIRQYNTSRNKINHTLRKHFKKTAHHTYTKH